MKQEADPLRTLVGGNGVTTIYSDANNIYLRKSKMSAHGNNEKSRHVFSGPDATRLGIFTSSYIRGELDYQTTPKHDLEVFIRIKVIKI